jgi:hypothetical protein
MLSPALHRLEVRPFFVKMPCPAVREGLWLSFVVDLWSFMEAFRGQSYRSLDSIQLIGNLKLRRIFTANAAGINSSGKELNLLPKQLCLPNWVESGV